MLKSLRSKKIAKKSVEIGFGDEKADYHQNGTDRMPKRQLLPEGNETFNRRLRQKLTEALKKALKR